MTETKTEKKTPAPVAIAGVIIKGLTRDPKALRILIACVLAVVSTAIEPPYLSLSSPEVQSALRAPESRAPLVIAAAFLTLAVVTLIGGTTGDLFGRRRLLMLGVAGVLLSNVLGIFLIGTPAFPLVDGFNTLTSVFVAPMAIALVTLAFEPVVRPFAYGMIFGFQGAAMALSPLIMSIAEGSGNFWIAFIPVVIIGTVALVLIWRNVPESRAPREMKRVNAIVNLIMLAAVFIVVFLVITGRTLLGNGLIAILGMAVLAIIAAKARWFARRVKYFSNMDLFTGRDVILSILAGVLLSVGQGAFFYQFATFNYEVQQTGPVQAALRIIPFVLGLMVASFMIARLALRFGARRLIVGGMGLMVIGFIWLSFVHVDTSFWFMLLPVTCIGFGFGVAVPARTQIVLSAPPTHLVGSAAAVNSAAGQSGYGLGVALSSAMVTQLADFNFIRALEQAGISPAVIQLVERTLPSLAARTLMADYPNLPPAIANLVTLGYEIAFTTGMTQMFLLMGIGLAIAAAAVYIFMSHGLRATIAPPVNQIKLDS